MRSWRAVALGLSTLALALTGYRALAPHESTVPCPPAAHAAALADEQAAPPERASRAPHGAPAAAPAVTERPVALRLLRETLEHAPDSELSDATNAVIALGGAEAHALLRGATHSPRSALRDAAFSALVNVDTTENRDFVRAALNGPNAASALNFFLDCRDPQALPALEHLARSPLPELNRAAVDALLAQGVRAESAFMRLLQADTELMDTLLTSPPHTQNARRALRAAAILRVHDGAISGGPVFDFLEQDLSAESREALLFAAHDRQTFWAVERADGYFALRSALSGKCLHVRGASTAGGAIIEQATCSFAYDQLWKPSLIDSSVMGLTSHFSGLSLNVAGDSASKDGQAIIQGQSDNSPDTQWRVTRRTTASYVDFSPHADLGLRIDHDAEVVTLDADDQTSAEFIVLPGLNDASLVSFQSRSDPGRYLRHAGFRLWTDTNDGTDLFKQDATFRYDQPFVGTDPLAKTIEAVNFPGRYWMLDGTNVSLLPISDAASQEGATWQLSGR